MARRVRHLYEWTGRAGEETLTPAGEISEARLRAWEYASDDHLFAFDRGKFHDTVRLWKTARPDLKQPDLWVGDLEEVETTNPLH
jgi:hypothetical protein